MLGDAAADGFAEALLSLVRPLGVFLDAMIYGEATWVGTVGTWAGTMGMGEKRISFFAEIFSKLRLYTTLSTPPIR
jgi:hypothetical protein